MAGINKNFKVQNGLEVATNLIIADSTKNQVGIATSVTNYTLHVNGGVGATSLYVSGVTTSTEVKGINLNFSGISTLGVITASNVTLQQLNVSGVSTLGVTTVTNLTGQRINISGITTLTQISAGGTTGQNQYVLTSTGIGLTWQSVTSTGGTGGSFGVSISDDTTTNATRYLVFTNATSGITSTQNVSSTKLTYNPLSGNIGIGSTLPTSKLTVAGDINLTGNLYQNGSPLISSKWIPGSGDDIYRLDGNVGIGISTLTQKLTVSGNVSAGQFISTVTEIAPFVVSSNTQVTNLNASLLRGKTPPTGSIIGDTDNQILTNKTLDLSNNTLSGSVLQFNAALSDDNFVTLTGSEILTNKTLTNPVISSISNSGTQTVPTGIGTLISTNSVGIITSGMISDGAIVDIDIASGAAIAISKLASSTISGVSLGSNLNNLSAGSYINYSSGSTYNGSAAITISIAATTANTANAIVARDVSGDFTAGTITGDAFNATASDAFRISGVAVIDSGKNLINVVNGNFTGIVTASSIKDTSGNVRAIPQNSQSVTYTLALTDVGKHVNITAGVGVTVPANIFSSGDAISIFNNTGTAKTVFVGSGVTMRLAGTASTGTRYLSQYALSTIICISNNVFAISGAGVT